MRLGRALHLVRLELVKDRGAVASSMFGVTVGVGCLVFFVSLGLGVRRQLEERLFPIDARVVEVIPSALSLGPFGGQLDERAVQRLSALPQVEQTFRKMNVRVPAVSFYDGDFFGRRLRMGLEVLAVGVEPGLVAADVKPGSFVDLEDGKPVPVVVSSRLLELYNASFAPARGLPQLSAPLLQGFRFPVEWNRSFVASAQPGGSGPAQGEVVGVSDRGLLAGVTIPLETAKKLNRRFKQDAETFTAVTVIAKAPGQVPALTSAIKEMGFRVDDSERKLAETAGLAVALTTAAFSLLSALICALAAFNIAHALSASVRAREKDLAVMRAVGATRSDLFTLVLLEAGAVGLTGGLLGTGLATAAAFAGETLASSVLPELKLEALFRLPPWLFALGALVGLVSAVVGALGAARRAATVDPARVLAG